MSASPLRVLLPTACTVPDDPAEAVLSELYDSTALPADRPRVQANMVHSLDGAIAGADGLSGTISSPADKRVFAVLRALADVVIVGASTIREEGYTRLPARPRFAQARRARGQSPAPALAIVTGSGNIDAKHINSAGDGEVLVLTSTDDPDVLSRLRRGFGAEAVVAMPSLEPAAVLTQLRARGMRRALCEGGPNLLGQWVQAGCVDELCTTLSPLLIGGEHTGIIGQTVFSPPQRLRVLSVVEGHSTLMLRCGLESA